MALERLKVKAGRQFDPNNAAHMEALVKKVSEIRGTGWSVQSWDPDTGQVTLVRGAALTELRGSKGGASFEVSLGSAIKPNEGELTAQRLEEEHDGFYLTEFRPHVKRARMTKMSEAELRCRDALANVIGVPRWEVQVTNRRGGGFAFQFPPKYSPSKHDDKILEVAESVVGRPGWYVKTDARALRGEIIPAEQPTFEPVYPFDFSSLPPANQVDDKELWRIPLGVALGGNGVPNHPISIDFSDSVGCLLVGLAGAGKLTAASSLHPVPASGRFPSGWARNDELQEGDQLYAPDGTTTRIVGFSEWAEAETYRVHFSDGQTVDVAGTHLWRASTAVTRVSHTPAQLARPRKRDLARAKADRLRKLADETPVGDLVTLSELARLTGYNATSLYAYADDLAELATPVQLSTGPAKEYSGDDLIRYWKNRSRPTFLHKPIGPTVVEQLAGQWLTTGELQQILASEVHEDRSGNVTDLCKRAGASHRTGNRSITVMAYPMDEALLLLADRFEARAAGVMPLERVVSTAEIAASLRYGTSQRANWAVRVPEAVAGETLDLPVDPYVFGVWLGDGHSNCGVITQGHSEACTDKAGVTDLLFLLGEVSRTHPGTRVVGTRGMTLRVPGLARELRSIGVINRKHIPAAYLRASMQQRLALLQGLMDSDGHISSTGGCELALSDQTLAADGLELIRSLGIKATMRVGPAGYRNDEGEYVRCKDRYRIHFTTSAEVFRLPRKKVRIPETVRATQRWNFIEKIEVLDVDRMRCVKVDHPEHLYLIEGFIPTHNSVTTQSVVFSALAKGWQLALINTVDKATDFAWAKSFVRDNFWGCDSVAQSVAVAKLIGEEGERRGALLSQYGASKWQDLPPQVKRENPPLMVVADELAALLTADPLPGGLSKEMKELPEFVAMAQTLLESKLLVTALGKLPAVYRAAGIRVIYLTQQPNERYGFSTKLKGNLPHRVMLGVSPSQAEKGHAFRTPEKIPDVPMNISQDSARARGVGLAHLDGQEPVVFKGYFAPLDTYIAEAKRRGFPTAIHPAPSAGQISRLVPRIDGDDDGIADSGGPSGGGGFGHGPRQYEPWELGPDGQPLTGFERANAARHQATIGAETSG